MIQVLGPYRALFHWTWGWFSALIEDERNNFIWLDLKVDISVASSLSLSVWIVRKSLSAPEVRLTTTFLHVVHRLLELPTVRTDKPHRPRPGLDCTTVVWANTVGHLVRFN